MHHLSPGPAHTPGGRTGDQEIDNRITARSGSPIMAILQQGPLRERGKAVLEQAVLPPSSRSDIARRGPIKW